MKCPYCGGEINMVHSSVIYGKNAPDYGNMYACQNYPKCDSYGGTTVASKQLRELRKECHRKFDQIWKSGSKSRKASYIWLSREMKKPREDCHISLFREDDCLRLLEILKPSSLF
jgi:ssDNA-binding Zn-finger/Zn-ribbon topoisomerase 1